jgi:hypothetical protein
MYFASVKSKKFESASVAWTPLRLQTPVNFSAYKDNLQPYQNILHHYDNFYKHWIFRHYIPGVVNQTSCFFINIYKGEKFLLPQSVLNIVSIPVPASSICGYSMFSCSSSHYPLARCSTATNAVFQCVNIFGNVKFNFEVDRVCSTNEGDEECI